jgi:TolB-like protein
MPALLLALALAAPAASRLAVLPVAAGEGIPASTAAALTEALVGEVRRRSGAEVVTSRDIAAVLSLERQSMLGCTTDVCMAELGGALGCERMVTGDLARLGKSLLLHIKVVETATAKVVAQSDRRLRGATIDDVLDALPEMVGELFPQAGAPATGAAASTRPPGRCEVVRSGKLSEAPATVPKGLVLLRYRVGVDATAEVTISGQRQRVPAYFVVAAGSCTASYRSTVGERTEQFDTEANTSYTKLVK